MRTIKEYYKPKKNLNNFNEQWDDLLNNVILPTVRRIEARTIAQELNSVQPTAAPTGLLLHHQNGVTNEINFPFWKIKVIFKNNIE